MAIRCSFSTFTMTSIVVCSRIDNCNTLLIGLPKVWLNQSVLKTAARHIPPLLKFSLTSRLIVNQFLWNLSARVQFKILLLILKPKLDVDPKYIPDRIRSPLSAASHRPLRSLYRHVLFGLRIGTTIMQTRSFTTIGLFLCVALASSLYVSPFSLGLFSHPSSNSKLFSRPALSVLELGALLYGHCYAWAALCKLRNTSNIII